MVEITLETSINIEVKHCIALRIFFKKFKIRKRKEWTASTCILKINPLLLAKLPTPVTIHCLSIPGPTYLDNSSVINDWQKRWVSTSKLLNGLKSEPPTLAPRSKPVNALEIIVPEEKQKSHGISKLLLGSLS